MIKFFASITVSIILFTGLTACGQKGPLYIPAETTETQQAEK